MKKLLFLISLSSLFMTACQKTVDQPVTENIMLEQQEVPRCGMEEAMVNMSAEMKQAMLSNTLKTDAQAAELLIFLDFDGAIVRRGNGNAQGGFVTSPIVGNGTFNCDAPNFTTAQKNIVIELVKDDFSPFNIQFTTEQSVYDAYPMANKQVCIVTRSPVDLGFPNGVAGVSPFPFIGFRLNNNPCFVFAGVFGNNLSEIASTISHEVGHTMGLDHQSLYSESCNFRFEYHPGFGTGPLSFSPIMGFGGKRIENWFAQPCLLRLWGVPQNDFVLLNNQVDLKEDDFPNQSGGGSIILENEITGVLEQAGDVDFIRINFRNPGPVTITSENIDIKASLFLPNGQLIAEYENPDDIHVTIPSANGLKYLKIEGISNVNMSSQFMTGQYKITH